MKNKCRVTPKNNHCGPVTEQQGNKDIICEPFEACLGLGRTLAYNGNCFELRGGNKVPDGWYDRIQIKNDCIVAVETAKESVYTPPPCAPAPSSCSSTGGGVSCSELISKKAENLTTCSSGKLLTTIHFGQGNVKVEGSGTANDPIRLNISGGGGSGSVVMSSNTLNITGSGTLQDAYLINLKKTGVAAGTYAGFNIDEYGRVTGYTQESSDVVKDITAGIGTSVDIAAGVYTINIAASGVKAGSYEFGGVTAKVDNTGRITDIKQTITLDQQTFDIGSKRFTINEFGSISKVVEIPPDTTGFATTFTATFRGGVADNERDVSVTMPLDGNIYVEYHGLLSGASTPTSTEGVSIRPSGVTITIDGIVVPDLVATVGAGGKVIGVRGTTANMLSAGTHIVTIISNNITVADGFIKVELVGRGG